MFYDERDKFKILQWAATNTNAKLNSKKNPKLCLVFLSQDVCTWPGPPYCAPGPVHHIVHLARSSILFTWPGPPYCSPGPVHHVVHLARSTMLKNQPFSCEFKIFKNFKLLKFSCCLSRICSSLLQSLWWISILKSIVDSL